MALKDWKKDKRFKNRWVNRNIGGRYDFDIIKINKEPNITENPMRGTPWTVTIFQERAFGSKKFTKRFKTKQQALKYAREYMRKH